MIRKCCYFVIVGLILIKPANASITLVNTPEGTTVIFPGRVIQDPIGCIYLDDQYLARLSPENIQTGKAVVKTSKLTDKIGGLNGFRITVFTEGIIANEPHLESQTSTFNFIRPSNFKYSGESHPIGNLSDFVAEKFAELRRIRARIIAEGAKWKADLTSIFMLPDEEYKMMYGFREPVNAHQNLPSHNTGKIPTLTSWDWTNKDGYNWMTSVKEQPPGHYGCWAFASVGQVEAVIKIDMNQPTMDIDLAEQGVINGCLWCGDCFHFGGWHYHALNYIQNTGIPIESDAPFTGEGDPLDPKWVDLWKIISYTRITWDSQDEGAIKSALVNHPLSTTIFSDIDLHNYIGGIYSFDDHGSPPTIPNHCVVLVGWDDDLNCWKFKNSWGDDWGENGYCRALRGQNNFLGCYTFDCDYQ